MSLETIQEIGKCDICEKEDAVILCIRHTWIGLKWRVICRKCKIIRDQVKSEELI